MKFCIDDANVEKIRRIYEYYPVDGVSTNPSILLMTQMLRRSAAFMSIIRLMAFPPTLRSWPRQEEIPLRY